MSKKVAVIMGSDSDFPVVSPAIRRLKQFGIPVEARVMSAHRTPEAAAEFSKNAEKDGFGVIIAAAGKAAHLAGVLAAHTTLPVIGIPVKSSFMDGSIAKQLHQMKVDMEQGVAKKNEALQQKVAEL